ncbi:MAG: hypothetical protein WDA06_01075 [Phenylobacterium sp.]
MNWRKPIIFILLYLSGSKIPRYLKEIDRIDSFSLKEQKEYQCKKLEKLLLYAWENVPFYRRVLEEVGVITVQKFYPGKLENVGVSDGVSVRLENFCKVPFLTKEIIRREGANLYSRDHKKRGSYKNTSGGSTGEPVEFLQDKNYDDWSIANKIYIKRKGGQDIGEKELRLWGSERDIFEGREKLSIRLRNWLYNRKELNAFRMSEQDMERFVGIWNNFRPTWVEAYAQSIYELAKFIQQKKLNIYSPRGIVTSAGMLYPEMKEKIEKVFKCFVHNRYGSREVGDMACSDEREKGLRLSIWNHYLEIIDGKIFITALSNFSMPLIRYDIGDMAESGEEWSYLKNIKGRVVNIFKNKKGELIDGEYFTHLFYMKNWVRNFQVVQKKLDLIHINIVLAEEKNNAGIQQIDNDIKVVMGNDCKIQWNFVDEIPPTKSGKYLYTISEVK